MTNTPKKAADRQQRKVTAQEIATSQALADLAAINATPTTAEGRQEAIAKAAAAKPVKLTRAQQKAEAKRRAAIQAEQDARAMSANTSKFSVLADFRPTPGKVPPLHIQNAMAEATIEDMKDDAREIANAAGKAAYEIVLGKTPRNQHTRQKRIAQAQIHAREQAELKKQQQAS